MLFRDRIFCKTPACCCLNSREFGLSLVKRKHTVIKPLTDALEDRGYATLTPVQEAVTEPGLAGLDLLVSAQTGSGKTVGFGLAIAPTVLGDADQFETPAAPLALIIAPTRELALQVKRELGWLYAKAGAVVASCVGGMDMRDERRALGRGAHIVVATPGRLRDHIMRGSIDLSALQAVVLDEADEMLDLGFREDLEFILGESPEERQTLMFSATVPQSIARLAQSYQKDAVRVVTKSEQTQHADIEYRAMNVSERDAENAVINTLRFYEAPNAIVFCNTRAVVNRLTTRLSNRGFSVVALSGELSQAERTNALQAMRDGRARVCVATDVAARGIDLPNLDLVIHAELPSNHETLLHRSGRTGRAGRKGVSSLVVTPKSRKKAERILKSAKLRAEWGAAPSAEEVLAGDEQRMLNSPVWNDEIAGSERDAVATLVETFSAEQIASAYLRLYRSQHSAPEELAGVDARPEPRAPFGPSVWFSLTGGRDQDAEPRKLLPMLCKAGGLSREDFGAIRVQQDQSYVEIRESSLGAFLKTIGPDMTVEAGAVLTQLDAPPAGIRSQRPAGPGHRGQRPAKPSRRPDAPKPNTPPVEWNDEPAPRARKPKAPNSPGKPKARTKPDAAPFDESRDGAVTRRKPRNKPKGPPPPAGKASSKKNKARKAAAKNPGKSLRGGGGAPRRGKS